MKLARRFMSRPWWCAFLASVGLLIAGAAWAGNGTAFPAGPEPRETQQDGSSPPPISAAPEPIPASASAQPSHAEGRKSDRHLMVLMLLGRAWSIGPFGRLGQ